LSGQQIKVKAPPHRYWLPWKKVIP